MTGLQEYDMEINLVHTIKGHGLCRLVAKVMNTPEDDPSG